MNAIANHSTQVRATCNFNTDGLNYTDYLRAKNMDYYSEIMDAKNMNTPISEATAATTVQPIFAKKIISMPTLIRITDRRKAVI